MAVISNQLTEIENKLEYVDILYIREVMFILIYIKDNVLDLYEWPAITPRCY